LRGLDEKTYDEYLKNEDITVRDGLKVMPPTVGVRRVDDEHHFRTGWLLAEDTTKKMLNVAMDAKKVVHKSYSIDGKKCLTKELFYEHLDNVRGIMMIAYPGFHGLGEWEPAWMILENKEESDEILMQHCSEDLDKDNCTLWIVNKEMVGGSGKKFSDYFGHNEKSKMVVKVTKRGGGAPVREPMVDPET
jgi:cilia- and flagella-associated protein 298